MQASEAELDSFSADDIKDFSPPQEVEFLAQIVDETVCTSNGISLLSCRCKPTNIVLDRLLVSDRFWYFELNGCKAISTSLNLRQQVALNDCLVFTYSVWHLVNFPLASEKARVEGLHKFSSHVRFGVFTVQYSFFPAYLDKREAVGHLASQANGRSV